MLTPKGITYQTSKGISIMSTSFFETGNFKDDLLQMLFASFRQLASKSGANIHILFDTEPLWDKILYKNEQISLLQRNNHGESILVIMCF